ncbi:hypothetical protein SYV04_35685 [Hyalangium sp. s54d21]|uniref:Uncharacterized protein n=1 Tax=Hyalangium rubrum TaxID=3103134 RepID=A0ABU5HEA3_9BACT|nr:hypothetical protein [Hyalangium sp. s54d21]MDY7231783.1 hypothetical protein [Hyalangium sp. s54d21]
MKLPESFLQLVACLGASMTMPTLTSLVTVVQGWLFAGRHNLTGVFVALGKGSAKHFSAYYRLFATAVRKCRDFSCSIPFRSVSEDLAPSDAAAQPV